MHDIVNELQSPLFDGIDPQERKAMLDCIGCHIGSFQKGEIVAFEGENIRHIGILLTLLHLGIRNIRLGPTLPAFISPNVLNLLVEKYGIAPISTPEEDLRAILGE